MRELRTMARAFVDAIAPFQRVMSAQQVHEFLHGKRSIRLCLPNTEDVIQRRIIASGRFYELELLEHASHLVLPGDVVLDVGANIGTHTVFFAAICGARVTAFEPNPTAVAALRENVRLNELTDRVTVVASGLGSGEQKADLVVTDPNNLGMCRLEANASGACAIHAFDEMGLDGPVKLVKIDVEGMELEALRGMSRMLGRHQPALYVEVQSEAALGAIRAHLASLGYALVECFNSTPTYCFLPARTAAQQFEAIMSRWDAAIRPRQRARTDTLTPDDRGPSADQLKELLAHVRTPAGAWAPKDAEAAAQLKTSTLQIAQLVTAVESLRQDVRCLAQLPKAVESLRQDVRRATLRARLIRLAKLFANPGKTWREIRRRVAALRKPTTKPGRDDCLVSVVMTSHNSAKFVEPAVRSILAQTHRNLELIVVDDASTDETVAILSRLQAEDGRLRVLRCYANRGTYWAKNLGLQHVRGSFVTTQDSDDTSATDRIERQLAALTRSPGALVATCNYVRVDADGKVVLNRGREQRLGLITVLFDRAAILGSAGFFDSVRTSADAEFLQRLRRRLPKSAFAHVDAPLYIARIRDGSLSANSVDLGSPHSGGLFLSEDRQRYVDSYEAWHQADPKPHMPFPLRSRAFAAPAAMQRGCSWGDDSITVSLASIPSRRAGLLRVVQALVDQVDRLNVYLNNYDDVPEFLRHPKIRVARSQDHGDIRDNGKFFFLAETDCGYCLTVDDDIFYPPDYVARLVAKVKQYGHQAIVGLHGTILPPRIERFFAPNGRTVLSFKQELVDDRQVHILGTGTTAWHTSTLPLALGDFESTGMADLWLAAKAQRLGVPMIAVARPQGFTTPLDPRDAKTLYEEFVHNDERQTKLVRSLEPWQMPPLRDPAPEPARTQPRNRA